MSSDGVSFQAEQYKEFTNEYLVPHCSAKFTRNLRDSYMVGALARFNNNYDQLHPRAKAAAEKLGMRPKVTNTFLNTAAQIVEIVHCTEDAIQIIDQLLERGVKPEPPAPVHLKPNAQGTGVCEVPRGMLIHSYTIDENGTMIGADCIIPTNQNVANLENDMRTLVPQIMHKPVEEMRLDLEMLVRAYDPCISCSVHVLKVSTQ
jgi:coenzyme F420-reducing hydrogenase alpha subunit